MKSAQKKIKGLTFECTCPSVPEQYDVKDKNGNQVGFVHLRWGYLYAQCPGINITDGNEEVVFDETFNDGWKGAFSDYKERDDYLEMIADEINRWIETHDVIEKLEAESE